MEGEKKNALVDYLCNRFGVQNIAQIKDTYGGGVNIWECARQTTINIDLDGGCIPPPTPQKTYQPKQLYNGMKVDLDCVSINQISLRYIKNNSKKNEYYLRHNFVAISNKEERERQAKFMKAAGRIPDVCYHIKPGMEAVIRDVIVEPNPEYLEMTDPCIRTYMMMFENGSDETLMRGIIKIDPELCAAAELPKVGTVYDMEKQMTVPLEIDYYVLVPQNHVLAWSLQCPDHLRKRQQMFVIDMEITPTNEDEDKYILYYIVDNKSFDRILKETKEAFQGRIDRRPLKDLKFELLDMEGNPTKGQVQVSIAVTYIAYPQQKPYPPFKPTLDPHFYPYVNVLHRKYEQERAQREQEEYERRLEEERMVIY